MGSKDSFIDDMETEEFILRREEMIGWGERSRWGSWMRKSAGTDFSTLIGLGRVMGCKGLSQRRRRRRRNISIKN